MRRAVKICYKDGTSKELEIAKGASIRGDAGLLYLERMKDDKWRLTVSQDIADDISHIDRLEMIREN